MDVALLEQFSPDSFACTAFKENVIGHNDSRPAVNFEQGFYVLQKVELLIGGSGIEAFPFVGEGFFFGFTLFVKDSDAALFTKGGISEHQIKVVAGMRKQAILRFYDGFVALALNAVEVEVHGAEADNAIGDIRATKGAIAQKAFLGFVKGVLGQDIVVGDEEESARATGRIANGFTGLGAHDLDHGLNQWSGGEVLSSPAFGVFGVFLQQTFVDVAFNIGIQANPGFVVNQLDQAFELGGVLDFILGFPEDDAEEALEFGQGFQGFAILRF